MSLSPRQAWLSHKSLIVFSTSAFLIFLLIWSLFAQLEQISRAPGQVIPTARTQVLQSTDGGVISEILVKEGDLVKRGQVLVRLDRVKIEAAVGETEGKVASLKSSMARINAELFNRPLVFPPDVQKFPDFVANQTMLYQKRRQALQDQLSSLQSMLALMQQELDMNMPLLKQGDVSRADVLRLQRGVSDIRAQIVNVRNKYLQDLQLEYTKTEEDLVTAREILAQRQDALKDTEIKAPTDGIVKNVRLTTIGGVLRPSDEVLSIVPTGERLIVEAKMSPSDIAYVRKGQKASVKFDAYDSSIFGSAVGNVIYVSPDTLTEQGPQGNLVFYRVHIAINTKTMKQYANGEKVEIQPGMTATAEIETGKHTVFRYLTKPLSKTFGEALTER
ncbi:MAG: HlyD family efflux transporter periplasmic adaptor subunit [Chakrabartia sp.]